MRTRCGACSHMSPRHQTAQDSMNCSVPQDKDELKAAWRAHCQERALSAAGNDRETAHLEEDTIDGSDKALNDEQPLPAAQTPKAVHVQKPSSQRCPYDLRHKTLSVTQHLHPMTGLTGLPSVKVKRLPPRRPASGLYSFQSHARPQASSTRKAVSGVANAVPVHVRLARQGHVKEVKGAGLSKSWTYVARHQYTSAQAKKAGALTLLRAVEEATEA